MRSNAKNKLFDLIWTVDKAGYEVSGNFIKPLTGKWKKYNPFNDTPGITREFSRIPFNLKTQTIDAKGAQSFANKYGLLGLENLQNEDLKAWAKMVILFWEIYSLIDGGLDIHARTVFNNFGPTPVLKLSISPGERKWFRSLEITPTTLYGAMWIMLANEITEGTRLQECEITGCGKWFTAKSNQKYCSAACKQRAYRKRIK